MINLFNTVGTCGREPAAEAGLAAEGAGDPTHEVLKANEGKHTFKDYIRS